MKTVRLTTYGARRHDRPAIEDVSVNCLGLRNPYSVAGDPVDIMRESPAFPLTLSMAMAHILEKLRHREMLDVGVFCAFGQHRSPFMAAVLAGQLSQLGISVLPTVHLHKEESRS